MSDVWSMMLAVVEPAADYVYQSDYCNSVRTISKTLAVKAAWGDEEV